MKRISKLLIVSALSVLVVACSKDRSREQQVSAMINKIESPFLIASVNLQNLMDKSEVMEEGTLPFTQYQVISFFLAVDVTGIDYDTDAQFIVGEGESFLPNFYGIFKVKEEEKFIELLEVEANATIQEQDGMKYAIKDSEGYCVVWNEEFAVISNIPMDIAAMLSGKGKGGKKMVDKNIAIIQAAEEGEINEEYVTFIEKKADLAMSFNGKPFYSYLSSMAVDDIEAIEEMQEIYEGMNFELFMNFEKGSMDLEIVADLDEELKTKLSFIGNAGVDNKLFAYGKSANPMVTMSYKADVAGFLAYYEGMSEEGYADMQKGLEDMGMEVQDVQEALSGEFVVMIEEVVKKDEVYDFGYDETITISNEEPIFGIVVGVADMSIIETKMEEVIIASTMQDVLASNDIDIDIETIEKLPEIKLLPNGVINTGDAFIFMLKDAVFMTNDSAWANVVAAGNGKNVSNPNGVLSENPFGIYADLTRLNKMEGMKDQAEIAAMLKSFSGSANLDGGKFTLELNDDSQNSLKIITVMVGAAMAEFEKNMNPDMEAELEEAVEMTDDAFDQLEEELEDVDLDKEVKDAFDKLEDM